MGLGKQRRDLAFRFRQTMLLIREFKVNWHTGTLLSADDLQFVRLGWDVALAQAEREQHIGDIYDRKPTGWAGGRGHKGGRAGRAGGRSGWRLGGRTCA